MIEENGYTMNDMVRIKHNQDEAISIGTNALERIIETLNGFSLHKSDLDMCLQFAQQGILGIEKALRRNPLPPSGRAHATKKIRKGLIDG